MNPNAFVPVAASLAVLLVAAAGFCLIIRATKLASRLFIIVLCIVAAPFVVSAVIGSLHGALHGATAPIPASWAFMALGLLALGAFAWFALHLKGLRMFQSWLIPHFGREVDGQVTGTYVVRLVGSVWGFMKFFAVAAVVLGLLSLVR